MPEMLEALGKSRKSWGEVKVYFKIDESGVMMTG